MKSPCHNTEMYGGEQLLCCPVCGKWYEAADDRFGKADEMMRMMGIDPSQLKR